MTPLAFFYAHAGWSYKPGEETPSRGRRRCAQALATAERKGLHAGLTFFWQPDDTATSADFDDSGAPPWELWECLCMNSRGRVVASLHAIDFGPEGRPAGDPYARVVEAELAQEALTK